MKWERTANPEFKFAIDFIQKLLETSTPGTSFELDSIGRHTIVLRNVAMLTATELNTVLLRLHSPAQLHSVPQSVADFLLLPISKKRKEKPSNSSPADPVPVVNCHRRVSVLMINFWLSYLSLVTAPKTTYSSTIHSSRLVCYGCTLGFLTDLFIVWRRLLLHTSMS